MSMEVYRGELASMVSQGALLIDVREDLAPDDEEALPGHRRLPLSRLAELAGSLGDRPTIFYCRTGLLSFQAAEIAAQWTEQPVYYLAGGLLSNRDF